MFEYFSSVRGVFCQFCARFSMKLREIRKDRIGGVKVEKIIRIEINRFPILIKISPRYLSMEIRFNNIIFNKRENFKFRITNRRRTHEDNGSSSLNDLEQPSDTSPISAFCICAQYSSVKGVVASRLRSRDDSSPTR